MSLNAAQERAAAHVGSVLISAGAGTGKTRVLAERLIRTLERGVRPRQIVAVTFTEAAASELRSRVEAYLAQRSASARARGDAGAYAATQLLRDELPEATISTIHSLAARIAREHPEVSGAGLGFEVLDEWQGAGWLRSQLRLALHDLPAAVFDHLSASKVFGLLETLLRSPDRALTALEQITTPAALLARWQVWLEMAQAEAWRASEPLRLDCLFTLLEHASIKPDALENARVAVLSILTSNDAPELQRLALEGALQGFSRRIGSRANWVADTYIAVRESLFALKQDLEQPVYAQRIGAIDIALAAALPHLCDAYRVALERLDASKLLEAKLSFDDLLRAANRALESDEVRGYYRERLRVLMVDEFQDTTPSQWLMLRALVHDGLELTVVGDEKQSIYGFTGATPAVFRDAERLMLERDGLRVSLDVSYRSHAALVATINQSFSAVFTGGATRFEALTASRDANPAAPLESVELHTVHGTRDDDARLVAKRIVALVKTRAVAMKTMPPEPADRPARYKDIAVVLRSFTDLAAYTAQLEAHGVPFVVIGGRGLLARREVRDAIALLKFLENPNDDHSLAIVLRGLWFTLPDDALLEIRSSAQAGLSWWDVLSITQPHAHDVLRTLLAASPGASADALLLSADQLTDFSVSLAALPDASRRLANIERFRAHLRDWQLSLPRLRDHLDDLEALEAELPEATPDSVDAVTIITIHKSKGLEYPIVLLPDLTRGSPPDTSGYRLDAELGLALTPDLHEYGEAKPVLYFLIDDLSKRRELEERARVLYVAATRAEDLLILSSQSKSRSDSAWERLIPHLPEDGVARFEPDLNALQLRAVRPALTRHARAADGDAGLDQLLIPDRLPISSLAQYGRCPQRFAWQYLRGLEPLEREWLGGEAESEERTYSRATIGSMVHTALERECRSDFDLEKLFENAHDDALAEVWSLVSAASRGSFAGLTPHTWQRELPISLTVHGIDLEGIVDAYQPELGWVLDFKTDAGVHPDHHLMQLTLYAKHLGAKRASLAYLRHDTLHEYSSADFERGQALLETVLTQIRAGQHAVTPSSQSCRYCAFQRQCPAYGTGI